MRKELAENIVIIGGTSMLAGFHHRLRAEQKYRHRGTLRHIEGHNS
jgi:actin-related protein